MIPRTHPATRIGLATTVALLAAAAFRSASGVLLEPLEAEFGWSRAVTSGAASLNLIVYGLATPFTAALLEHVGVRKTVSVSLVIVAAASAATWFMREPWHLWLLWGLFIGAGTGSLALTFGTIVANRWFVWRRGLITGIFSAATAAGQVIFVPLIAAAVAGPGWRAAVLGQALFALATAALCAVVLRDRPSDLGVLPLGAAEGDVVETDAAPDPRGPLVATLAVLRRQARRWPFWVLMLTFFACGWSTNGLIVTHLLPAASDAHLATVAAAGLIAVIGSFDIVGTIAAGWLTDRLDPRRLLAVIYAVRGLALVPLANLLTAQIGLPLWAWTVFYGLAWTATVPPTVELCRRHVGAEDSGIAFGWIYAAHMIGAGAGAYAAGVLRQMTGSYTSAWWAGAGVCLVAAALTLTLPRAGASPVSLGDLGYGGGPAYVAERG